WQAVQGDLPRDLRADERPVVYVSHIDGVEFCARLQERTGVAFRLPTEAEWEYACRAGTSTPYWAGRQEDALGRIAWYTQNSSNDRQPVATKPPNPWGLYDMHGNAWEWCQDGRRYYPSEEESDPMGGEMNVRVARGGSFSGGSRVCRAAC